MVMLSLIGLPPTAGFVGKTILFMALWEQVQHTGSLVFAALLVASCLSTVLSLHYYLKLPYQLFCGTTQPSIHTSQVNRTEQVVFIGLVLLLLMGFFTASSTIKIISNWSR